MKSLLQAPSNPESPTNHWLLVAALLPVLGYLTTVMFFLNQHTGAGNAWLFFTVLLTLLYLIGVIVNRQWLRWSAVLVFLYSFGLFFMASVIIARFNANQPLLPHDGALQLEAAAWELREGHNPYAVNYAPSLAAFVDINNLQGEVIHNPALNHLVYLPFHIILTLAGRELIYPLLGWFDIRLLHWSIFFAALILALSWRRVSEGKQQLWLLLAVLNPLLFPFMLQGRGDALVFALVLLGLLLLSRRSFIPAAVIFGLAFATRQTTWFLFPFLCLYLLGAYRRGEIPRIVLKKSVAVFAVVFMLIMSPFFFWSPRDFMDDTLLYTVGESTVRYPINGFGLGTQLVTLGLIPSLNSYFPFWIIQLIVIIPLLIWLWRWQARDNTIERMILAHAVWLGTFWLFSRFFHENYLGYLVELLLLAWWWDGHLKHPASPTNAKPLLPACAEASAGRRFGSEAPANAAGRENIKTLKQ